MDRYDFRADLLDTFQSAPDGIKALMLVLPFAFLLGGAALLLHHRRASRRLDRLEAADWAAREADRDRMMEAALADLRLQEGGDTLEARDRLERHFAAQLPERRVLIGRD